ncbi:putative integrase [Legionella busanensis]|uniref:Putative integrase n=1 Tax=Legionella busanensis TaxID=190655 RepID=A0A378JIE3_9GAMM|nr:phage integrase N-terminal domain-containing protein [Legionella busanensis]STX50914.1 putative integrase [Legionella busanensis]
MRKQSLRQAANRYLQLDNRGSIKDKKHRTFVIHKMINDLFKLGIVPCSWLSLNHDHIHYLIIHWKKEKIKPATMMDYMTTIRIFLSNIGHHIEKFDNKSLGLTRSYSGKRKKQVSEDFWINIIDPMPRLIMGLQTQFGLTFREAISLIPDIHIQEHTLWITREIAFNSLDRIIPIRYDQQKQIVEELIQFTQGNRNLVNSLPYEAIRVLWRSALSAHKLSSNKTYRYLYAQQLKKNLSPVLGCYQTNWIIRDEMGIKSPNTLWLYLNE